LLLGELSLEEAIDLSGDRQILDLKNNYNLQRFKPPRERAPVLNESEAGWAPEPVWSPSNSPRTDPKEKARFYIDVVAK
jgi:hypothetical protein